MKSIELLEAIGEVRNIYIQDILFPIQTTQNALGSMNSCRDAKGAYGLSEKTSRQGEEKRLERYSLRKRFWLIAAIVALTLLLVGCAVVYMMHLDDLVLGKESDATGGTEEITLLSLQGFADSPNYQAAKEWMEFLNSYDTDKSILHSLSNEEVDSFNDEYYSYTCYTDEMANKIEEICKKYGLQKQGIPLHEQSWDNICHALQVNDLISITSGIQVEAGGGYIYRSGTFKVDTNIAFSQSENWCSLEIYCTAKTDFDDVYMVIADMDSYEQWNYTRADGIEVLIAMRSDSAFIFAENTNYFFKAGLAFTSESEINKQSVEQLAEDLNLSFTLKHIEDEAWAYLENSQMEREELLPLGTYKNGTYDERVRFHLENKPDPEQLEYALVDIDGNGDLDLLIGRNGVIRHVYMSNGIDTVEKPFNPIMRKIKMTDYGYADYTNAASYIYICEGNKALYVFEEANGFTSYMIAAVVDGEMNWIDILMEKPTENAYYSLDTCFYEESPISKEEFQEKLNSCIPIEIKMTPISQYPFADI